VVVADLNGAEAERVAGEIGGTGMAIDVRDEAAIQQLVTTTEDTHGPIGLFVSNAGYVTTAGLEDPNESIQRMWEVHCMAHIYAARAVIPSMIAQGEGYLLNTASAAGLLTQIGSMSYSITKAAAVSLAEWLAVTHHHQGIRVSVLCPQAVRTNIVKNSPTNLEGRDRDLEGGVASGDGVLEPSDVAALCLEAIRDERFLVLPHPEVATYVERKATDRDRWLAGMRRFQAALYPDGPLPGDAIAPRL
jgi:NAD(P)-dependent dehydrogenase (short-subunit alcohol dehydrogenase family)